MSEVILTPFDEIAKDNQESKEGLSCFNYYDEFSLISTKLKKDYMCHILDKDNMYQILDKDTIKNKNIENNNKL